MFIGSPRRALAPIAPQPLPLACLEAMDRRLRQTVFHPLLVAVICTGGWLLLTQVIRMIGFGGFYGVPVALAAVVVAAWTAGTRAGLITAALSVLFLYELLPSMRMLQVQEESIWHLTVFSLVALTMSGFQAALRQQHLQDQREKEMRDEFLAIVSHELRTPVTVISGGANLLSRLWDNLTAEDRKEVLDSLQEESARLTGMIEDLLLLGRIEDERQAAVEPLLLQPNLAQAVNTFRRLYPARDVELALPQERIAVLAQSTYFEAVVRNVLSNAHRFSPITEPVEVSATHSGPCAYIRIRDHGPGVAKRLLDEIYEPYFRSQPLTDGTRGIGLGLALCKRAMEAMNGRISAETLESGGLEVTLTFHLAGGES